MRTLHAWLVPALFGLVAVGGFAACDGGPGAEVTFPSSNGKEPSAGGQEPGGGGKEPAGGGQEPGSSGNEPASGGSEPPSASSSGSVSSSGGVVSGNGSSSGGKGSSSSSSSSGGSTTDCPPCTGTYNCTYAGSPAFPIAPTAESGGACLILDVDVTLECGGSVLGLTDSGTMGTIGSWHPSGNGGFVATGDGVTLTCTQ